MKIVKMILLWVTAAIVAIAATLILPAYPILSGIMYAYAFENLERIADEKEI